MTEERNVPGMLNPWRRRKSYPLSMVEGGVNDLFDELLSTWFRPGVRANELSAFNPRVNIAENDQALTVTAELPGVDEKDVDVSLHDGVLRIRGEKKARHEEGEGESRYVESSFGSFERAFSLPCEVDEDKIDAQFAKGILTVKLPKELGEKAKSKKISIRSS